MSYSRRDFGKLAVSGLSIAAIPGSKLWAQAAQVANFANSNVRGVHLGMIGTSLHGALVIRTPGAAGGPGGPGGRPPGPPPTPPTAAEQLTAVDTFIDDLKALGIQYLEAGYNETGKPRLVGSTPQQNRQKAGVEVSPEYTTSREAVRQWRLTEPLDFPKAVAAKFKAAGIDYFSGVVTIEDDATDEEIDADFKRMQACGVRTFCTNGTRVTIAPKLVEPAAKYNIKPAFHNHDLGNDPAEVDSVESLEKLLAMSPNFMINLDMGHFVAGNKDPLAFVKAHPTRISHLHVKDRKKDHGPSVVWGTGDTPIIPVLRAIRDNKWPIACIIERDNGDEAGRLMDSMEKDWDYMRKALEA
jgi:sugar phosphate isomerase/epimerase